MTQGEAEAYISSQDPGTVADEDIVDSETGEVFIEKGDLWGSSFLHVSYQRKEREKLARAQIDRERKARRREDLTRLFQGRGRDAAESAWQAALDDYVSNWGPESLEDLGGISAEAAAQDGVDSFFYEYPEWRQWAEKLDMSKADMRSILADYVYDAVAG